MKRNFTGKTRDRLAKKYGEKVYKYKIVKRGNSRVLPMGNKTHIVLSRGD